MWYTTEPNKFFQPDIFLMQCEPMTILPDRSDLVIEQVSMTNEVTIAVCAASPAAPCPCCGTISKQIQSRYTRTLRDLPESRTSCTSGYSRAPLLLSREYMRAQNLCRTLSFSHVATLSNSPCACKRRSEIWALHWAGRRAHAWART